MLDYGFRLLGDREENTTPLKVKKLVDTHVHIFPDKILEALWWWFDNYAWPIRYKMKSHGIIDYLLKRNVDHIVTLQYAHKPGVAEYLNSFSSGIKEKYGNKITALATVYPGEKDSERILKDAFDKGLYGVKLHAHVQCFEMLSGGMDIIYDLCQKEEKPLVIHAGREPKSPMYPCDPYEICNYSLVESVLRNYPDLKLCVPHLGVDEFDQYRNLIEKYENLWLDTAMVVTDYLPVELPFSLKDMRSDRIMYGTDFPNIPYAWDRELKTLVNSGLDEEKLDLILYKNARDFFNIDFK